MKNVLKTIVLMIVLMIVSFSLFISEESVRLSNNSDFKPLIILSKESSYQKIAYNSIGFSLINEYGYGQLDFNKTKKVIVGQTFLLFDKFLIWGWIS